MLRNQFIILNLQKMKRYKPVLCAGNCFSYKFFVQNVQGPFYGNKQLQSNMIRDEINLIAFCNRLVFSWSPGYELCLFLFSLGKSSKYDRKLKKLIV